jgi:phosphoglycolate phosphatase-like HAD superfamily hydrolase
MFQEVFHIPGRLTDIAFSGKTTPNILREVCALHGLPAEQVEAALPEAIRILTERLFEEAGTDLSGAVLPGVRPLLDCLNARGHLLGILTGNPPEMGSRVLAGACLRDYFRLFTFGTEARERTALVQLSLMKAQRDHHFDGDGRAVAVVGDSVHDVACAKPVGALSVAVATGVHSREELRAAGADHVFPSCEPSEEICDVLSAG